MATGQSSPPTSASAEFHTPDQPSASTPSYAGNRLSTVAPPGDTVEVSQAESIQLAQDTEHVEPASSQEDALGGASEQEDNEEPDGSDDEDWSEDDEAPDDEVLTGKSAGSEVEEEDISSNLVDVCLLQCVANLIAGDKCERRCLEGKARELEWLTCSLDQMTKTEKPTCIFTLVGVLMQTDTATRRCGTGVREKCHYFLPFVGHVCRTAFAQCHGVQPLTIQLYKLRIRNGNISAKEHGNKVYKNTSKIDAVWLVKWLKQFAPEVGEVVPVRVRMQKTKDGVVTKYYSRENYTLLPAIFTWDFLYDEMHMFVNLGLRVNPIAAILILGICILQVP